MSQDYIQTLADLPAKQSGLIFEQLNSYSLVAVVIMRTFGYFLPGGTHVPTQDDVYQHLCDLTNEALEGYFGAQKLAPANNTPDDIKGFADDDAFKVEVTGQPPEDGYGFTVDLTYRLAYR